MTAADWIDDLARLAEAATPGPWVADHSATPLLDNSAVKQEGSAWWDGLAVCGRPADAEFIAAVNPATILRLIEELRRWKAAWEMASPLLTERDELAAKVAAAEALAKGWAVMAAQAMDADTREWLAAASRSVFAALSAASTDTREGV